MFQAQNRETKLVLEKLLCPPISLWGRAWQDCISQVHNTTQNLQDQDQDRFFWSQTGLVLRPTVSDHITGLGSAVSSPAWFRAEPWPPKDFFTIFSTQDGSPDTIILYYCGSKNEKFLTRSILSQLLTLLCILVMLFDVFLVYETKFTVGKWQVMDFTAGKRRGRWGDSTLGGNPPKQCRIKTIWALAHRRN